MGGTKTKVDPKQDTVAARSKARTLAKQLLGGSPKAKSEIENQFVYFRGHARLAFAEELAAQFDERPREGESETEFSATERIGTTTGVWIFSPTKKTKVERGGTSYQFFAQVMEETSKSISVEVFTQSTVTAEGGIGIEGKAGPVKFSFGVKAAIQKGVKEAEKDEVKNANRSGKTATRTFMAQRISHEVLALYWNKVYYGVEKPTSYSSMGLGSAQLARRVTYDQRAVSFLTEYGFQLIPKEGGDPWGPFWPDYDGSGGEIHQSAQKKVREELDQLRRKFAEEVANGYAP